MRNERNLLPPLEPLSSILKRDNFKLRNEKKKKMQRGNIKTPKM